MKQSTTNVLIYAIAILICLATTQAQEKIFQEKKWEYGYRGEGYDSRVNILIIPGDTSVLVTDSKLRTFELDLMTGKKLNDYTGKINGGLEFTPDGKYLYTYNFEKIEWPSGKTIGMITPHPNSTLRGELCPISKLSFNFKTNRLVVLAWMADSWYPGNSIRGIRVYDLKDMKLIDTLGETNTGVYSVRITNDGKYIVAHGEKFIRWVATPDHSYKPELKDKILIYDIETLKLMPEDDAIYKTESFVRSHNATFSKDGALIYYTKDNYLFAVDSKTLEEKIKKKFNIPMIDYSPTRLSLSEDEKLILTNTNTYNPSQTRIYDIESGMLISGYYGLLLTKSIFIKNNRYLLCIGGGNVFLLNVLGDETNVKNSNIIKGIFPNPFKNTISISNDNFVSGNLEIILFDEKGAMIKTLFTGEYKAQDKLDFDLSKLSSGDYLILAYQNGITKTMKIVKE